ncbi:alpha-galactosidase [Pedobacter rhizosphaerae]|uniref:Melibiase n=1 Tax=Pedobacter rhizosphaerae TaxID=390241 RepID=A0A1H9TJA4_9SPHI|nr:alpha-galactosidase [Pedobacter rhizosphaerae]SER97127.1 Melibiase [Pedobacter rhizosphaerae]
MQIHKKIYKDWPLTIQPFLLILTFILISMSCLAQDECYSRLDKDTLTIGNQYIERKFIWNKGNIITYSLSDKKGKRVWFNRNKKPDFSVPADDGARNANYLLFSRKADAVKFAAQETIVSFSIGGLDIKRIYRLTAQSPSIACETYLKGKMDGVRGAQSANAADQKNIEFVEDMLINGSAAVLDQIKLDGYHWQGKAVEFFDVTDWNNNLVQEYKFIPYRKRTHRGNLLFAHNQEKEAGIFFLKEAPSSNVQLAYGGEDFTTEFGHFAVNGLGLSARDIRTDDWRKAYTVVLGVYSGQELEQLQALRSYQKTIRKNEPQRDEMVMMNTWGDRSQDAKVNERFSLLELEAAAKLGITHFQIDDGWQQGKSPNSALAKGSFKNIWDNSNYWKPDTAKYPNGLDPIVKKGKALGIEICLWFNPSIQQDYADWEKDASAMVKLYQMYGIRTFKIDGLSIPNKQSEINLGKMFNKVLSETENQAVFNLDATAGRRGGYHLFTEYGNIFLENRYTDWQNYYPYWTLRNLWQLSKYVPPEKLQIEFLNKWRNADKYGNDPFAPSKYAFEYLFASTMAAQPLAWFEGTGLPEEALKLGRLVAKYKKVQHDFHQGVILPVGEEPSGRSWTGFQSLQKDRGYLIVFRENTSDGIGTLETWFSENVKIQLNPLLGKGKSMIQTTGRKGSIKVELPAKNDFVMYSYTILR